MPDGGRRGSPAASRRRRSARWRGAGRVWRRRAGPTGCGPRGRARRRASRCAVGGRAAGAIGVRVRVAGARRRGRLPGRPDTGAAAGRLGGAERRRGQAATSSARRASAATRATLPHLMRRSSGSSMSLPAGRGARIRPPLLPSGTAHGPAQADLRPHAAARPAADADQRKKILADTEAAIGRGGEVVSSTTGASARWPTRSHKTKEAEYHLLQFHGDAELLDAARPHAADHRRRDPLPHHQARARHPGTAGPPRRGRRRAGAAAAAAAPRTPPRPRVVAQPVPRPSPPLRGSDAARPAPKRHGRSRAARRPRNKPAVFAASRERVPPTPALDWPPDLPISTFAPERSDQPHGCHEHQSGGSHREPHLGPRAALAAQRHVRLQAARRRATRAARTARAATGSTSPTTST